MARFCAACLGWLAAASWPATTASPLSSPSPAVFATASPPPPPSAPPTPPHPLLLPPHHARAQVLLHVRPTTLTLAGDSAGGNLALATTLLLLHPHYTSLTRDSHHFRAHSTHAAKPQEQRLLSDAAACRHVASQCLHAPPRASPRMQAPAAASDCSTTTTLASLLLLYPCLDPSRSGGSHAQHAASPTLAAAELEWFWKQYVPGNPP
jgi:hypothetical protein